MELEWWNPLVGDNWAVCIDDADELDAANEIELEQPGIFGPRGGHGRAVLISRMSWTLGSFLGPILSGVLIERVGYYQMSCTLGVIRLDSAGNGPC